MKLSIHTLILGAGYAGLIANDRIQPKSIIIEKGYKHGHAGNDYIVFTKNEYSFSSNPIEVDVNKYSSGRASFATEYAEKLYNTKKPATLFSGDERSEQTIGYPINSEPLLESANIYGNIVAIKIDVERKVLHGKILHLNEDVEISYSILINTIPIHRLAKLINLNLLNALDLFISYSPIGVKRYESEEYSDEMKLSYYSDPNIPFYRKHHYGSTIYYEYCINKPFNDRFDTVIVPGKFKKINRNILISTYDYLETRSIYLVGRFATWDPDFLLDDIMVEREINNPFVDHLRRLYDQY